MKYDSSNKLGMVTLLNKSQFSCVAGFSKIPKHIVENTTRKVSFNSSRCQ